MTDTKLRVIRQYLAAVKSYDLKPSENMLSETEARTLNAALELLAHIDALAAEVERLKDIERRHDELQKDWEADANVIHPLRDLVREADGIIGDAYGSHYDARLSADDRCAWCKRADVWRKKAQA